MLCIYNHIKKGLHYFGVIINNLCSRHVQKLKQNASKRKNKMLVN